MEQQLVEELRWVDEEAAKARSELEDRIVHLLEAMERRVLQQVDDKFGELRAKLERVSLAVGELGGHVELLERDLDDERERAVRTLELVTKALTPPPAPPQGGGRRRVERLLEHDDPIKARNDADGD